MAKLKLGAGALGGIFVVGAVTGGDEADGASDSKQSTPEPPPVPNKPVMAPLVTGLGSVVGAGILGLGGIVYHQRMGDKHARHAINVAQNGVHQLTRQRADEQLQRRIAERAALDTPTTAAGGAAAQVADESIPSFLRPGADGGESTIAAAEEVARRDQLVRDAQREARRAGRKARISGVVTTISDTPLTGVRARHAAIWTGAAGLAALGAYMLYTSGSNLVHNITT